MVFQDLLRWAAFFVDSLIYKIIPLLYKLIIYLANLNIGAGTSHTLAALINRVYILVGIFMLFKLAFSILHYIVDPDSFSDKSKGFTSLIKRVIIAVILLVFVPLIFEKAYELQGIILEKNVIPNLIMGTSNTTKVDDIEGMARDLQFTLFGSFFTVNYEEPSLTSCTPDTNYPLADVIGSRDMVRVSDGECLRAFSDAINDDDLSSYGIALEDFFKTANSSDVKKYDVIDERKFDSFYPLVNWKTDTNKYAINYVSLATIICGGYLAFLLLSFCIDIAGRVIRLVFMQILSPIAILSSVDPTSSNQDDRLKEWAKECLKVYVSLFIRLAVIYCAVQLVKIITETVTNQNADLYYGNLEASSSMNKLVCVFLILGIFQVAKKLPELLEKALGVKLSGELNLNPFKNGFVAAATGLGIAGAGALVANTIGAGSRIRNLWGDYLAKDKASSNANKARDLAKSRLDKVSSDYEAIDSRLREVGQHSIYTADLKHAKEVLAKRKVAAQEDYNNKQAAAQKAADDFKEVSSGKKMRHNFVQSASAIAGIATGAAAAAIRGARGAYGKDVAGAFSAANAARKTTTDRRNDRDVRSDSLTLLDRAENARAQFANIKDSKTYGVGKLDSEIKELKNELTRLQSQMRAANENIVNAQQGTSGISDTKLRSLIDKLNTAISVSDRTNISNEINAALSTAAISTADKDAVEKLINSVTFADTLLEQSIKVQKQISQREDATNAGHGGGDKK
ncbi:MAG: hypothetical protein IKG27_04615 [Bacilli bacterium]|nr:hypothetical protein [Bacilli bacterium]